jgi:gamma-glutamylcyclotransferase
MTTLNRYYFAYGSNMSAWVMSELCVEHDISGPARLDNYRLAFTRWSSGWRSGVSDIIESPGDVVWGVIYRIGDVCHDALDEMENYGKGYTSTGVDVTRFDGKVFHAITYTVIEKSPQEIMPSRHYLDTIVEGAAQNKLPADYIRRLKQIKVRNYI